jgi:HSP20 family protein
LENTMSCQTNGQNCGCNASGQATTKTEATRVGPTFRPDVDIYETGEEYVLTADLPGARADSINLHLDKGVLTLSADVPPREHPDGRPIASEYGVGRFERSFRVGEGIDAERIGAEFKNGVLTLRFPKAEETRGRKIPVQPGT